MESVEVELDQTVGHDGESLADEGASFEVASLEVASLDVDPATPSRSGKYVKVGIAVASMLALGAGVVAGTMKNRNAQSKSVSALANGSTSGNALSSSANGSSDGSGGPYDCGGKSGKKGGYGYGGYEGTFEFYGRGYCTGDPFSIDVSQSTSQLGRFFAKSYDGLFIFFRDRDGGNAPTKNLCQRTCSKIGGPGFRGVTFFAPPATEPPQEADCACHYDDGHAPDCPSSDDLMDFGGRRFNCAKSEAGAASGPISDSIRNPPGAVGEFGSARCYIAVDSYGGKSGKSKGYGTAGAGDKSGKSSLSSVGDGSCRDSEGDIYDSVLFFLAGFVETHPEDEEPNLLGLCEAKCKSPPSLNPDIEYYAAHGFVGLEYKQLYSETFDPADINSLSAESISSSFVDELDEVVNEMAITQFVEEIAIAQVVEEHLGTFLDVMKANDGRRLSSKSAKSGSQLDLVVSACICDYTDGAISCDANFGEERGVANIFSDSEPPDIGNYPLTAVDLNLSGLPYLAISTTCSDFLEGQGPVKRARRPGTGFECYSNNGFGQFYDGPSPICHLHFEPEGTLSTTDALTTDGDTSTAAQSINSPGPAPGPTSLASFESVTLSTTDASTDGDTSTAAQSINSPGPTPGPTSLASFESTLGSTPTVSTEVTGPPTKEDRFSNDGFV